MVNGLRGGLVRPGGVCSAVFLLQLVQMKGLLLETSCLATVAALLEQDTRLRRIAGVRDIHVIDGWVEKRGGI